MANTNTYHISSVAFPTAEYDDRYISIDQTASTLEQGFQVNSINALSGARDSKINNYSSFYMTGRNKLTNFLSVSSLAASQSTSLVTKLGFERPGTEPSKYLYIFKTNIDATDSQKALGVKTLNTTGLFDNNFFFEIEALNNNLCRIKHNNGRFDFYLNYNSTYDSFVFYQNVDNYKDITQERNDVFRYVLDNDGYLQLFKFHNNVLNIVTLSGDTVVLKPLRAGSLNRGLANLIHIDYNLDQNKQFLNKSFASYNNQKTTNLILDTANINVDENGQYLFVTNYNSISADKMPMNYINLDTNRSEFNFIKRGSTMVESPLGVGQDPREYYGIYAGNDQEKGLTKLNLNYSFYDKDVFIVNGTDTYFTAPSSMYPYEKLNLNDTQFAFNGAFAGPTPNLSDKIFIKRQNSTQYDNGRYLCTWLSGGTLGVQGIWVDRYYYPDKISKSAALSSTATYAPSFFDSVDSVDLAVTDAVINREKFFDKKSDSAIVPNGSIKYQRIGNADITEIINSSAPIVSAFDSYTTSKLVRGETVNFCTEYIGRELLFNGSNYSKFAVTDQIDASKNFTLSFDMYIDPSNQYGFALMGNNTNKGFGIFQDQTVTPFIHVVSGNTLYIYNTDFTLLNRVDFKTKIKQVFKRSALDDFIITCAGNLFYKVNSQGNKIKLECGSDILDYYGAYQTHDHIDFISSDQLVRRINTNTFSVSTLSADEFDVYKTEFCLYDNVIEYKDTVFKLPGIKTTWENDSTAFYQVSSYIVKHDFDRAPEAFLKSDDIKDFIVVNDKIYILKATEFFVFDTSGVFNLSGSISNITIPSPVTQTTVALSGGEFISIDWVNEYVNGVNYQYPVILAHGNDDKLYLAKGTITSLTAAALSDVTIASNTKNIKLTNYNVLNRIYDAETIDFKLSLRNYLNTEDVLTKTISFSQAEFDPGFYNLTYRLDTKQGNSTLYINGELYDNQTFAPGKYLIQDIYNDEFFIGTAGFQSDLDLSTYLKQPGYYYTKDLDIKNPFIYNRAIDTELVYALYLFEKKIDDIVLSIPAGQRTSKTEIQQFFKFNRTNSSNHIDVVVRNLNITDVVVRDQIKTSILAEAKSFAPVGVTINEVRFLDY